MTKYSMGVDGSATPDAIRDAYLTGLAHGIARGAVMAMTPDQQRADQRRQAAIAARRARADRVAAQQPKNPRPGWPTLMPGGWPLPPEIPPDDETLWWPEHDGWPCPPPALRGGQA